MPLIYAALESDNPVVLERALKVVPGLSETLDYTVSMMLSSTFVGRSKRRMMTARADLTPTLLIAEQTVKQTLFPKITTVFTKTTMLSVKVK